MRAMSAAAVAALMLAGCQGGGDTAPADRFYRIAIAAPAAPEVPSLPGTVTVGRLGTSGAAGAVIAMR